MGKNFTSAFVVCALLSSLPLACGDDEDDGGGNGGKGGKGGSAGMTGGTSGAAGRTGGSGGGPTGGAPTGGAPTGGAAGRGGAGAGGMTGGTAGMDGGMGGETDGGMGGVPPEGGMGGQGGDGTTAPICERYCDAGAVANCTNTRANCIQACEDVYTYGSVNPLCEALTDALYECHIASPPASWMCNGTQPVSTEATCMDEGAAAIAEYCLP